MLGSVIQHLWYNKISIVAVPLLFVVAFANAQTFDSLQVSAGTIGTVASEGYQPLWLVANRYGSVSDQKADFSTHFGVKNTHHIKLKSTPEGKAYYGYISYGLRVFNNQHLKNSFLQEGYVKAGYKNWEIRAGRFREIIGEVDQDLSSGSLGVSGNTLPIPQVGIALTEYRKVPFTGGWLQFKGQLTHGWMGKNQYLKDAFLHQKTFYMRLGKNRLKLFGGVQHFAVWGGGRADWLQLDRDWKGFVGVLLVKEADDGSLLNGTVRDGKVPDGAYVMRPNRPGDHRGVVDGGLEWEGEKVKLKMYHQTPFDMGIGISFKNIDKLAGLSLASKNPSSFFQKVLVEAVHTKQMTDWMPRHRESYYNNGIYKTGWEYENQIIGTPLFINRVRGSKYSSEIVPYDWDAPASTIQGNQNILVNRILGGHFGLMLSPAPKITTRSMVTLIRHYGSRKPFSPHKDQWYGLQEVVYQSPVNGLRFTAGLAVDYGELTRNTGGMLGVEWLVRPFGRK